MITFTSWNRLLWKEFRQYLPMLIVCSALPLLGLLAYKVNQSMTNHNPTTVNLLNGLLPYLLDIMGFLTLVLMILFIAQSFGNNQQQQSFSTRHFELEPAWELLAKYLVGLLIALLVGGIVRAVLHALNFDTVNHLYQQTLLTFPLVHLLTFVLTAFTSQMWGFLLGTFCMLIVSTGLYPVNNPSMATISQADLQFIIFGLSLLIIVLKVRHQLSTVIRVSALIGLFLCCFVLPNNPRTEAKSLKAVNITESSPLKDKPQLTGWYKRNTPDGSLVFDLPRVTMVQVHPNGIEYNRHVLANQIKPYPIFQPHPNALKPDGSLFMQFRNFQTDLFREHRFPAWTIPLYFAGRTAMILAIPNKTMDRLTISRWDVPADRLQSITFLSISPQILLKFKSINNDYQNLSWVSPDGHYALLQLPARYSEDGWDLFNIDIQGQSMQAVYAGRKGYVIGIAWNSNNATISHEYQPIRINCATGSVEAINLHVDGRRVQ